MSTGRTGGAVAAIDLGASSGRVIAGRVDPNRLNATTVARFVNTPVPLADGLHTDILSLYAAALAGLGEAFRQRMPTTPTALPADGQSEGSA